MKKSILASLSALCGKNLRAFMVAAFVIGTAGCSLGGLVVYLFFLKRGQFKDLEEGKYVVFYEDHDDNNSI